MKKSLCVILTIMTLFSMAHAQNLPLEKILSNHYEAIGLEKLQKINTIIMTGTMVQQDAMPMKIIRMRHDQYLLQFDIQDITAYQGYDGQTAWWTTPWTGNPKPMVMPDDRAKDVKSKSDFDGLLYNWKIKGHVVELLGLDSIEKSPVYKLKITKKDNGIEFLFLDAKKFLLLKRLYYRTVRGKEVPVEIYFRDYRSVEGILFSFTQETYMGGQPYNAIEFDSIELNKPVDNKIFKMPLEKAP